MPDSLNHAPWRDTLYRESYISHTPYYSEEASVSSLGDAGQPLHYAVATDSLVSASLVGCILLTLFILTKSWRLIRFQARNLFRTPRENSIELRETSNEMRYQVFFIVQGIIVLSLMAYHVATDYNPLWHTQRHYAVLALFAAVFAFYFLGRELLLWVVQGVFFHDSQRRLDLLSRFFMLAVQGALLLPVAMFSIYMQLSPSLTIHIVLALLLVVLLLNLQKTYSIFFRGQGSLMAFMLYTLTMEVVPILNTGLALLFVANYLKII